MSNEALRISDPWDEEQPQAATLLDNVHEFLRRFVAYPSPETAVAHALWVAHCHLMQCWDTTPRIAFLSKEPASGKTRALEITALLVPRPIQAVNMSSAALFRLVGSEDGLPTVLFDEIDAVFGPRAKENEELRGLLNAGYRRGNKTYRCAIHGGRVDVEEIEAYSAVALAGIGDLPDTILTRSVIVRMKRRAPGERVEPYRYRTCGAEGEALRDCLADWADSISNRAASSRPPLPDGIEDRNADIWEPLVVVADLAGGHWPDLVRVAAVTLVAAARDDNPSVGVKLLADIRVIFERHGDAEIETGALLDALCKLEESPWADFRGRPLNAMLLGRMLRGYGPRSETIRFGNRTAKGYRRAHFNDAWQRYLPLESEKPVTLVTPVAIAGDGPESQGRVTSVTGVTAFVALAGKDAPCSRCGGEGCQWCGAAV
jgi:hypothetical protein